MKFKIIMTSILMLSISSSLFAGYGRASSSGGYRSSSYSSPRSYSAPRSYAAPPQRTVVREYHHTTTHAPETGSGMGIGSTIAASAAGSMIGNALTNNHGSAAAQPQVVYVNGQPQQVAQAVPQPFAGQTDQSYPVNQPQVYDSPTYPDKEKRASNFLWFSLAMLIVLGLGVSYQLGRRN